MPRSIYNTVQTIGNIFPLGKKDNLSNSLYIKDELGFNAEAIYPMVRGIKTAIIKSHILNLSLTLKIFIPLPPKTHFIIKYDVYLYFILFIYL